MSGADLWEVHIDDDSGEGGLWGEGVTLDDAANAAATRLIDDGYPEDGDVYDVTANLNAVWVDVAGMPWDAEMTGSEETRTGTVTIHGKPGAWSWVFVWDEVPRG